MDLAKHGRRPRLELKLRHHPDNLHALYREGEDPVERSRWHAIWLRFGSCQDVCVSVCVRGAYRS